MKIVAGILSLLIALAIVAYVARQQVHVVAAPAGLPPASSPVAQERQLEQQINQDVQKALRAGMERDADADRREEGTRP